LPEASRPTRAGQARILLVILSLAWGLHWPMMKIALGEVTPWTLRMLGYVLGALFMFALVRLRGDSAKVPFGPAWAHIVVSALLNMVGFGLLTAFAQANALTSRVVIVAYTMPIWASLMAWLIFRERLNLVTGLALVLCVIGLAVLIHPLMTLGVPLGLVLALASALSWAAGTLYVKWARIGGNLIAITAWQLLVSFVVVVGLLPMFEGGSHLRPLQWQTIAALAYHVVIGVALAQFLWFEIVKRLPAATASLGSLCVPVVGILSSMALLGDRPSIADGLGFTLIFAAAACVLLQPSASKV
jgi:drug/metabolite transporter (DMT)-like permease